MAPAAFVVFVPFASYLFLILTRRSLGFQWMRHFTTLEGAHLQATRARTTMAIGFISVSQILATALIIDGFGDDPFARLALVCGFGEWGAALAWVGLLIAGSSPRDASSRNEPE